MHSYIACAEMKNATYDEIAPRPVNYLEPAPNMTPFTHSICFPKPNPCSAGRCLNCIEDHELEFDGRA
jgi:hypothetical protein